MAFRVLAYAPDRAIQRQISRALVSGGLELSFGSAGPEDPRALLSGPADVLLIDADAFTDEQLSRLFVEARSEAAPILLLAEAGRRDALLKLLRDEPSFNHLVAKHRSPARQYALLNECELRVSCHKAASGELFGIDKYIAGWGVAQKTRQLSALSEKPALLAEVEEFSEKLAFPRGAVGEIVTVVDELIINAAVHAPRDERGTPKYESGGARPDLSLAPSEAVTVMWASDAQRLMVSVTDNFGVLARGTILRYVCRSAEKELSLESKPSGAGLGLSMSFKNVHQLIFNVEPGRRTEVIAGWWLRVDSQDEFRRVAKSLNLFAARQRAG